MIEPPAWVEIDLDALRQNVAKVRAAVGPAVRVFAVCKGDAYGCGLVPVANTVLHEGADAIAVGNVEEAQRLRAAGITAPILLYGSADGRTTAEIARLGITVTAFDLDGLRELAAANHQIEVYAKLDCGFGRLGFALENWSLALDALSAAPNLILSGLYAHIGAPENVELVAQQMARFAGMASQAKHRGFAVPEHMVASSRVVVTSADCHLRVCPESLCGIAEPS